MEWKPQSSGTNIDLAIEHLLKIQSACVYNGAIYDVADKGFAS